MFRKFERVHQFRGILLLLLTLFVPNSASILNQDNDKYHVLVKRAKNTPLMNNCVEKKPKQAIPLKAEVMISPYKVGDNSKITGYYDYTYIKMELIEKVTGEKVSIPIDILPLIKENYITFPPYTLSGGLYKLTFNIEIKKQYQNYTSLPRPDRQNVCYIKMRGVPPVVVIKGGSYKSISPFTEIVLNGSESLNLNKENGTNKNLAYHWSCKQQTDPPTFCAKDPFSTKSSDTIPYKVVTHGEKFEITLNVTTPEGYNGIFTQVVEVQTNVAELEIFCVKNCPPIADTSSFQSITFLKEQCKAKCDGLKEDDFLWSIKDASGPVQFDCVKDTQFGCNIDKFIIKENLLKPGNYTVTVDLKPGAVRNGRARMELLYKAPPKIEHCEIVPPTGDTLTYFNLKCVQDEDSKENYYNLLIRDSQDPTVETSVVNSYYPEINDIPFRLPPSNGKIFVVKVSQLSGGPPAEIEVKAEVQSAIKSSSDATDTMKKLYDGVYDGKQSKNLSVPGLLFSNDSKTRQTAMSTFTSLVDELLNIQVEDEEVTKFINDLKYRATEDMLKAPLSTTDDVLQVSSAITKLMAYKEVPKTDPLLAKFTTTVCKKMMEKYMDIMQNETFPQNLADKAAKVSHSLTRCLEINTNPNFEALQPIDQNVTTDAPSDDLPVITEHYENYVDYNEQYYKNLDNLKEATYNIINATASSTKVTAMTMVAGEKYVETFGHITSSIVAKDIGTILAKAKVTSQGVTVFPSQEWAENNHSFDILLSTWSRDIMWWNPKKTKVSSDIASIQFWHSTCKERITEFTLPVTVLFTVHKNSSSQTNIFEKTLTVPKDYLKMSNEDLNYYIQVTRITVPKGFTVHTQFYNLSESDIFDVVTTKLKFPTMEDFAKNNKTISIKSEPYLSLINNESSDIWFYIGILPNKLSVANNTDLKYLKYRFSFTLHSCVRWNVVNSTWEFACKSGEIINMSVISCQCFSFSVLAAYIQQIESLSQEIVNPDIELKLQVTFIIFVTVLLTLGLFGILSIFVTWIEKTEFFYLADNTQNQRFAYIVVITTSNSRNSGTTSNVTMKLSGDEKSSEPHLLNYPDPKLRLLQRYGEDIFILTTEHHLGNLRQIELWNDSRGPNPDWVCKSILVYDMQDYSAWYFDVNKRLSVIKGNHRIIVEPTTEKHIGKKFGFNIKMHTWWLFHNEDHFCYLKKLTVILSMVLMTYLSALIFLGLPSLQISDCFDLQYYHIDEFILLLAFLSSFPSFVLHKLVVWCFRLSKVQILYYKQEHKMPYWVTLMCWSLIVLLTLSSLSILIFFGFWVPPTKSWLWLTVSMIGVVLIIFIYENICIILESFFCKFEPIQSIKGKFSVIWNVTEGQRWFLYGKFGGLLLKPYFKHLHKPLSEHEIKEKRFIIQRRREIISELEDLIMFGVYIVILYVVILANKDNMIVKCKQDMEDIMKGLYTRTLNFEEIRSIYHIYDYINSTLIPSIQPLRWYGKFVISDPGQMTDVVNKYIGIVRFRQLRMMTNTCTTAKQMQFLNMSCRPEFSLRYTETRTFGYGWGPYSTYLFTDRLKSIWEYSSQSSTGTLASVGKFSTYGGGGYVAYLGRTLYNSFANFRKLSEKFWIDQETRSIFIEFLTYNVNYNVFCSVKMVLEQSASGYTVGDLDVYAVRMLLMNFEMAKITIIFFAVFMIWVTILFFKKSLGILKKFRTFYKDTWFMIDILIIIMSMSCIIMFITRARMVGSYLDELQTKKHNEFLNYFYLFYIEDFLTILAAVLICISTVRLWKFLRFGLMFRIFEKTLSLAAAPLLTVTFCYACLLLGFSMSLVVLYEDEFARLESVAKIVRLLVTIFLKPAEVDIGSYTKYSLTFLFFSVFIIICLVTVFIFITIICMCYAAAQLELSGEITPYNIKYYVLEQIEYLPKFFRYKYFRLRGGQDVEEMVKPKSDKFVYTNSFSVLTTKMKTMRNVTRCVIRNMKQSVVKRNYLTKSDLDQMMAVCRHFLVKPVFNGDVDVFFKGQVVGERSRFIDELRITQMAEVVSRVLQQKTESSASFGRRSIIFDRCIQSVREKQSDLKMCEMVLKSLLFKIESAESKWSKKLK